MRSATNASSPDMSMIMATTMASPLAASLYYVPAMRLSFLSETPAPSRQQHGALSRWQVPVCGARLGRSLALVSCRWICEGKIVLALGV